MSLTNTADVTALERELSEMKERVADLQSDKMLIEEELKEAITGRDEVEGAKSAKVSFSNQNGNSSVGHKTMCADFYPTSTKGLVKIF